MYVLSELDSTLGWNVHWEEYLVLYSVYVRTYNVHLCMYVCNRAFLV